MTIIEDKNFDDLAAKFTKKIYGGFKGKVRLAVLTKDIKQFLPDIFVKAKTKPLNILDAGGGYGPFSFDLAQLGHHVTLCDISEKMLKKATERAEQKNINTCVELVKKAIQDMPQTKNGYDLILCHAVLEWVQDPQELISHLVRQMKDNGLLSITFYNLHGMIFKNLLRINYKKIVKEKYAGWPGSLTPTFPRTPEQVLSWLSQQHLNILCHSGIRVFHDYILDLEDKEKKLDTALALELKFSRQLPYRDLGRYQHILVSKDNSTITG